MADTNLMKAVLHPQCNTQLDVILDKVLDKIHIINTTDYDLEDIPAIFIKQAKVIRQGCLPVFKLYIILVWLQMGYDLAYFEWCLAPLDAVTQAKFLVNLRAYFVRHYTGQKLDGTKYEGSDFTGPAKYDTHCGRLVQVVLGDLARL
jgi:hypothetical protein